MNELKGKPTNQNHSPNPSHFNLRKSIFVDVDTSIQYKHRYCDSDTVCAVSLGF